MPDIKINVPRAESPTALSIPVEFADGATTTVHVLVRRRAETAVRVMVFPEAERLVQWCQRVGLSDAVTGGFFSRKTGRPLGKVWMNGFEVASDSFGKHRAGDRSALFTDGDELRIAALRELPREPRGNLLTATWEGELDDEWTQIRAQRTAIGYDDTRIWVVAVDGPATTDASRQESGCDITELATIMQAFGATDALNLDGGGGSSLVAGGELINRPRAGIYDEGYQPGDVMDAGRRIHTAIALLQR
jgi:hypothetical protein